MTRAARPPTLGADKGYDSADFVMALRGKGVTPDRRRTPAAAVRQLTTDRQSSGDAISQRIRKRVDEAFGWAKTVAGLRKIRHRGLL